MIQLFISSVFHYLYLSTNKWLEFFIQPYQVLTIIFSILLTRWLLGANWLFPGAMTLSFLQKYSWWPLHIVVPASLCQGQAFRKSYWFCPERLMHWFQLHYYYYFLVMHWFQLSLLFFQNSNNYFQLFWITRCFCTQIGCHLIFRTSEDLKC